MAGEDEAYRKAVSRLKCAKCGMPGPSQVHHMTGAGMGLRAHDHKSMPLCAQCHIDLHGLCGQFKGYTKESLTTWQQLAVSCTWSLVRIQQIDDGEIF